MLNIGKTTGSALGANSLPVTCRLYPVAGGKVRAMTRRPRTSSVTRDSYTGIEPSKRVLPPEVEPVMLAPPVRDASEATTSE